MIGQCAVMWSVQCDASGCGSHFEGLSQSCMAVMHDAVSHGWHVMRDGVAYCPDHSHIRESEL